MFFFIPKAKEQCSLCDTSFLWENTNHTCMQVDTHSDIPCVSVWHVVQNTVHVATSQHPGGEETSSDVSAFKLRGGEGVRREEVGREKAPFSSFLPRFPTTLLPVFSFLPSTSYQSSTSSTPIALLTAWDCCLTPLRHISPVIIVSTNRESRLTSTGVVSILGGGGWIVSAFGFEAILVASSCSSKILGRLK